MQYKEGTIKEALVNYVNAAIEYLYCDDYFNLTRVLSFMSSNCIPKLSVEEIEDLKSVDKCDVDALLTYITAKDEKRIFEKLVKDIRYAISKLPKTIEEKHKLVSK